MNVQILLGDVTQPKGEGKKIIAHIVNDIGTMGAGVALAIRNKWPSVYGKYDNWCNYKFDFNNGHLPVLGQIQYVSINDEIGVINMIAQRGVGGEEIDGEWVPPIKYESLRECLLRVRKGLKSRPEFSLHLPMIGSALAGGDWVEIYEIIREILDEIPGELYIYAFDEKNLELAVFADQQYEFQKSVVPY